MSLGGFSAAYKRGGTGGGLACAAHHLLQGGAAAERAGEQREAVDEGGEEVRGQRRQGAPGEHGDHIGDDV